MKELNQEAAGAGRGRKAGAAVRFAAFVLVFLLLLNQVSAILLHKSGSEIDMIHSFYKLKRNSLDAICLGSSHAYYSFQPNVLWEEYGLTSYVMGTPDQTLICSLALLKDALRYQSPRVVFLEGYFLRYDSLYKNEGRLRVVTDGMPFGEAKKELIDTLLPELGWKEKLPWYFPFLTYHVRWKNLKASDFHQAAFYKGTRITESVMPLKDPGLDVEPVELPQTAIDSFNEIRALCEKNNILLVVYDSPFVRNTEDDEKQSSFEKRLGSCLAAEAWLKEQGVPFFWFQRTEEWGIDFATDFFDEAHVNLAGGTKITKALAEYALEHVELASHKGDRKYASWEKDYQDYLDYLKKHDKKKEREENSI